MGQRPAALHQLQAVSCRVLPWHHGYLTRTSNVAFIAAITTIISLAIGPFTQQAVKTTFCENILDGTSAQVPIASKIGSDEISLGSHGVKGEMNFQPESHLALLSGILGPPSPSLSSALDFTCPTGNCTFPAFNDITYSSLGICSRCEDVTASIRESKCDGDVRSCNYTMTPPFSPPVSIRPYSDVLDVPSSGTDDLKRYNLVNTSLLIRTKDGCTDGDGSRECPTHDDAPGLTQTNLVGATCSLYSCIKRYHGEIRGGEIRERVVSSEALRPNGSEFMVRPYMGVTMPCIIDGALY
ncbi:hypothetical protein IMZ48_06650, partial [Candidatus Bathyarchaeota archaeon]|nr:hypothetical protein [Candidatus Bathyarchaeota archaeon]